MIMGYACPVCEAPQQDAAHLADHLAFTAIVHHDDHESWLEEHVGDWGQYGTDDLAEIVVELATSVKYDQVFEDTVHRQHGRQMHDNSHHTTSAGDEVEIGTMTETMETQMDEETQTVINEARKLTAQMIHTEDEGGDATNDEKTDARERLTNKSDDSADSTE
jgi:membrane-associated HD superfamily phosphohydrolase